jgi:hypothetical protein
MRLTPDIFCERAQVTLTLALLAGCVANVALVCVFL